MNQDKDLTFLATCENDDLNTCRHYGCLDALSPDGIVDSKELA